MPRFDLIQRYSSLTYQRVWWRLGSFHLLPLIPQVTPLAESEAPWPSSMAPGRNAGTNSRALWLCILTAELACTWCCALSFASGFSLSRKSILRNGTTDYQTRRIDIDFELQPYYCSTPLSFTDAQQTLKFSNIRTILEFERYYKTTTGLDATAVRAASRHFPKDPNADPEMPIASESFQHLSVDVEGIASNTDGT